MFKDKGGRWRTKSLFEEEYKYSDPKAEPLFSLRCGGGKPCLHCAFLETGDPTGYKLATEKLGGWVHLQLLLSRKWFQTHWDIWQDEMEIKLRSEGITKQRQLALKGNQNASKWLAEKGWLPKRQAGAPTKEERTRQLKMDSRLKDELEEDWKRVMTH